MADKVDTNDVISVLNRLDFLANKSRVGTPGIGPDKGKVFKGGLTSEEMDESNRLSATVEQLLKASRPVYGIKNPDGTTTLSYTNPTAAAEEAYRQQYGANTSLAQAGMSPYGGGKVLTWAQKQEAMKRVEELRPNYASLSYAQQQEFDAIQRNLYASILVNKDNPNPPEANATSIYDNTSELLQQYGFNQSLTGVQVGAAPGSMPGATPAGPVKTLVSQTTDSKGSIVNKYSDGSTITVAKDNTVTSTAATTANGNLGIQTGMSPTLTTGITPTSTPTTNFVATDGTKFTTQDAFTTYQSNLNQKAADTRSAIQIVTDRFNKYGLGSLAAKIQELAVLGATEATITLGLQETPEYQARFSANQNRLKQGLTVLSPAEYLSVEDGYRQVLRAYGLKQFDTDAYVQQFISNNTSPGEFSNRVVTAVQRIQNADPAVIKQLRDYYGIGSADMVAYVLDPEQQFEKIKLQVAASEIGVMAGRQGLTAGVGVAEQLAKQGVTQAEAQKGYSTIADILPTAEKLSGIYGQTTGTTYGQSEAEQEVFNSLASAQRARQRLSSLEVAQFSGQSGLSKAALSTQNKGNF